MPETQRRRHVWLVGVPVNHDLAANVADRAQEPTRSRLGRALRQETLVPKLDRDDEERLLRALMTECPRELDELYHALLRRCHTSRDTEHNA